MIVKAKSAQTFLQLTGEIAALIAIIVVAAFIWDRPLEMFLRLHSDLPLRETAEVIGILGTPWPYVGLAAFALLFCGMTWVNTGFYFRTVPPRALLVILASVASWATANALQPIFGRSRPHLDLEHHVYTFQPFSGNVDFSSFPSSHTAVSAAMAVVFSIFFPAYRLTFFGFAALIAASRIAAGYHYPSDTVAGAALGIAIVAALERGFDYLGLPVRPVKRKWP